ncbi:MAG: high-affinity nickel-transporter [Pyrinomonadaceae bacterium]
MRLKPAIFGLVLMTVFVISPWAHPLGNFTVNQYTRLETGSTRINIRQVLDMAEIPTFQESSAIDTDRDGSFSLDEVDNYALLMTPAYAAKLLLTVNGEAVVIKAVSTEAVLTPGAGDLPTLRITWGMTADIPADIGAGRISFQNKNYAERAGWNEVVVTQASGVSVFNSSSYGNSISDELKNFNAQSLFAPLSERVAEYSFTTGKMPAGAEPLRNRDGQVSQPASKDTFAELISVPEITPMVALFGLLAALGLGAIHAMSPGHGKTVVGAYLVGSRGTAKHAAFLGLTVTITHTLGVFALGLITLFASRYILPERLMPFLGFVSGLLVFFIGMSLLKDRLVALYRGGSGTDLHHAEHVHDSSDVVHSHDGVTHSHGGAEHAHAMPAEITWRSLLALGISGGLLPCPSALVLMLSAISLGRIGYGLVLTVVFSLGLATTLTAIGLIFLYIGNAFGRTTFAQSRIVKMLPVFSALVVTCIGAVICYNSLG